MHWIVAPLFQPVLIAVPKNQFCSTESWTPKKNQLLLELLERGAHYLFIISKDNLVSRPLTPSHAKEAWWRCSAMWDNPDCSSRPTIHHPSPPSPSQPPLLPWKSSLQVIPALASRGDRLAITDHSPLPIIFDDHIRRLAGGWGGQCQPVLEAGSSLLHAPLSLKSPRKPLFLIPCLGHVSYLILPA